MSNLTRVTDTLILVKSKLNGAIQRILNDKLGDTVSVKDFGDTSVNATSAFSLALSSGAKYITVPSGTYVVHSMVIPDGVCLQAESPDGESTTLVFNGDLFFPLQLGSRSSVIGLTLDFSQCTQSDKAIYSKDTHGVVIRGNTIIGASTGHTMYLDGTGFTGLFQKPIKVLDNYITGGLGAGVYIYGVKEFDVSGNKLHGTGDGILATGVTRIRCSSSITDNVVMDSSGQGIATMLISNARDTQAYEGLVVAGNRVERAGANGIIIQSDLTVCADNVVMDCGNQIAHQGILVNANGVTVSSNVVRNNAGVGIDLGNCRKTTVIGNHVEENGWLGIEVNRCEQVAVIGNILNLNLRGKTSAQGDLQAGILCHKGSGGYPFTGENRDITISGNTINGGDGQTYGIFTDAGSYRISISNNVCRSSGKTEDIVVSNADVAVSDDNITRWSPAGTMARATIQGETVRINAADKFVAVNGTGNVQEILAKEGAIPNGTTLRIMAINGFTLKSGANVSIPSDTPLAPNQSYLLWWNPWISKWVKA